MTLKQGASWMRRGLSVAMLALLEACTDREPGTQAIALSPCRLDGLGVEAKCGQYSVFESRDTRQGRQLRLRVAVVPALAASPRADPLFVLVGGPGQAATEAGARVAEALRDVRKKRDIVLVDQRGTGSSNPLDCHSDEEQPLAKRFAPVSDVAETRACQADLDADTTLYTTPVAMDDLDEVRRALGYERINLWGGSYGTRAALVYFRQHPSHVRSLVLDGSAPTAMMLPLFVARDAQHALDDLYAACERDQDCKNVFPGARAAFDSLLSSLAARPAETRVAHPRTGSVESLRIEREGLASVVTNLLYVPELAGLIPLGVDRANRGDFGALIAGAEAFAGAVSLSTGMFLSIVCAEDLPQITDAMALAAPQGTFLGGEWLGRLRAECAEWRAGELPATYFEPIAGDVPSLLLSGRLDPVTPPVWGDLVASQLSQSRHVVVPGAGHGVSSLGCVPELIDEFLELLAPLELDASCVDRLQRPGFFTSLAGPSP